MLKDELLNEAEEKGFMKGLDYALSKIEEYKSDYITEFAASGIKGFDKIHKEIANRVVTEISNHIFMDCLCFHAQFANEKNFLNQNDSEETENLDISGNNLEAEEKSKPFYAEVPQTSEK